MKGFLLRLVRLVRWGASARDIDDEMRFHVEMETAENVRRGFGPVEARRRALVSFGGEDRWREAARATRGTSWIEDAVRDVRLAARGLRHSPGFAFAALATIGLGIGSTTTVFGVVDGVLLSPLPYPDADRLVTVWMRNPAQGIEEDITSWPNFVDWRTASTTLSAMASVRPARVTLTGDGEPVELRGATVSRGFFELIGAPLALGRGFRDDEVEGEPVRVAVLGHGLWTRRYGADPSIVGREIRIDDVPWEVVGVTMPGASYPADAELWLPQGFGPGAEQLREARGALWLPVVGRLAPGVLLPTAQAEMDAVAARLEEAYPRVNEGVGITLEPLRETLVGDVRAPLLVLLGAVTAVLLIVVGNVANLLLARGAYRSRELAVRLTLGAGRGRIVRQVVAESLLLGVTGGLAGVVTAWLAMAVLTKAAPAALPRLDSIGVDGTMLGFALAVAVGASAVFGLLPAVGAARITPLEKLGDGARGSSRRGLARLRGAFVTLQLGLALLLLICSGLLMRSFVNLRSVDAGFTPERVLMARLALPASRYGAEERGVFQDELVAALRAIPGVSEAGSVGTFFLGPLPDMGPVSIEGREELFEATRDVSVVQDVMTPGFLTAAGMDLLEGRGLSPSDGPESEPVAIVNEAFVRAFLDGEPAVGTRFAWGEASDDAYWIRVVGVVRDARRSGLDRAVRPDAFLPFAQERPRTFDVLVRTGGDPLAAARALRDAVHGIDAQLPVTELRTLDQALAASLSDRRFVTGVLGLFALAALVLAAVGVFGVVAYVVGQRTREIGIRVALGAHRGRVVAEVLREGMTYAGSGLVLGLLGSLAITRLVRSQLFGLEPTDPTTFALGAATLLGVAALACILPARRAAGVDAMIALREE